MVNVENLNEKIDKLGVAVDSITEASKIIDKVVEINQKQAEFNKNAVIILEETKQLNKKQHDYNEEYSRKLQQLEYFLVNKMEEEQKNNELLIKEKAQGLDILVREKSEQSEKNIGNQIKVSAHDLQHELTTLVEEKINSLTMEVLTLKKLSIILGSVNVLLIISTLIYLLIK